MSESNKIDKNTCLFHEVNVPFILPINITFSLLQESEITRFLYLVTQHEKHYKNDSNLTTYQLSKYFFKQEFEFFF